MTAAVRVGRATWSAHFELGETPLANAYIAAFPRVPLRELDLGHVPRALRGASETVSRAANATSADLALDIASNDGLLLSCGHSAGCS